MKTDLEILIEHLQSEYDYLKSSMDECVAEWDFDGAKAFREPLIFTRRKLNVLKCLENPNFKKINELVGMVSSCLLYTSPSPRDRQKSRMPSSA